MTAITVEAGVTLADVQAAAEAAGRLFSVSLASEGSATIGGALATNAGGVQVLAYAQARALALGLEAVMADGRVWHGLSALKKDNTGFDLRDLLIGSEGTLGIITAATVKLFPMPRETVTALIAVRDLASVLALFRHAENRAGTSLTAFEFMCRDVLAMVADHAGGKVPFEDIPPWSVLLKSRLLQAAARLMETRKVLIGDALERGYALDAVIASSLDQAKALWRLREACSEAQKGEGGSISSMMSRFPSNALEHLLRMRHARSSASAPVPRPVPFGHFGDGNVHYNVSQPRGMDKARYLSLWEDMSRAVHDVVLSHGGSISAEHGIGQMKRGELLPREKPARSRLHAPHQGRARPPWHPQSGKIV